jgi:hypothetical protein
VQVARKDGVAAPRSFSDYTVAVDTMELPAGVKMTALVS